MPGSATQPDVDRKRLLYRWDLDKTYLRTEFDTVRDIIRTAFESPLHKQTVPGAATLLREIRATEPAGIFILSGSPEQMRKVLEAKLRLDGVQWDSFVLKPSLRQLVRGKLRFLKDQVGYKLASLLRSRVDSDDDLQELLFGDDAEADAFIYSLYSDLCAGRVGEATLVAVLERARVHDKDIPGIVELSSRVGRSEVTRRIFIHLDRVSPVSAFAELGPRLCPFHNYFQPAVALLEEGALDAGAALRVGADIIIQHAFSPDALIASFMDLAHRGHVGRGAALALVERMTTAGGTELAGAADALAVLVEQLERRLPRLAPWEPPGEPPVIDYLALFSRERERSRAGRRRARARRI